MYNTVLSYIPVVDIEVCNFVKWIILKRHKCDSKALQVHLCSVKYTEICTFQSWLVYSCRETKYQHVNFCEKVN